MQGRKLQEVILNRMFQVWLNVGPGLSPVSRLAAPIHRRQQHIIPPYTTATCAFKPQLWTCCLAFVIQQATPIFSGQILVSYDLLQILIMSLGCKRSWICTFRLRQVLIAYTGYFYTLSILRSSSWEILYFSLKLRGTVRHKRRRWTTIKLSIDSSKRRSVIHSMKTIMLSFKTSLGLRPKVQFFYCLNSFLHPHTAVTIHIYLFRELWGKPQKLQLFQQEQIKMSLWEQWRALPELLHLPLAQRGLPALLPQRYRWHGPVQKRALLHWNWRLGFKLS